MTVGDAVERAFLPALAPLGYVAKTEEDACKHVALFAAGLRDAAPLLKADEVAVRWARELRWWNSKPLAEESI